MDKCNVYWWGKGHPHFIGYRCSADHRTYWIRLEIELSGQKGVESATRNKLLADNIVFSFVSLLDIRKFRKLEGYC